MTRRISFGVVLALVMVVGTRHTVEASTITNLQANDAYTSAQNIDGFFSLDFSPNIGDNTGANTSTSIPHVTINAFGANAGNGTQDWYSFVVGFANSVGIFDIDYGMSDQSGNLTNDFDANLQLLDSAGNNLFLNDDYNPPSVGAGGSIHSYDSFVQYVFPTAGTYEIGVGRCCFMFPVASGQDYALQVSIGDHSLQSSQVPEPASLMLLGTGVLAVIRTMRRRKA